MKLAVISITNRCNFKCKMCDIGQRNSESSGLVPNLLGQDELSPPKWSSLLSNLGVNAVDIVGVEPLLYPHFSVLLRWIKTGNSGSRRIRLTTNGWLFEKWLSYIGEKVDLTTTSIDGLAETHNRIRGVDGAFERAFKGITTLRDWGKKVRVSFAITPENVSDMKAYYDLMTSNGIPVVFNHYNYIHPDSCKNTSAKSSNMVYDLTSIDTDQLLSAIKHCKKASYLPRLTTKAQLDRYYKQPPTSRYKTMKGCKVLNENAKGKRFVINSDGTLIPGNRCWICKEIGNALEGARPRDVGWIKKTANDIKKNGFYPPCQRLCCAGKTV